MALQAIIRAVCTIIDGFHFRMADEDGLAATSAPDAATDDAPGIHNEPAEEEADGAADAEGAEAKAEAGEIQRVLVKRVLPVLQAQLVRPYSFPPAIAHFPCSISDAVMDLVKDGVWCWIGG